MSFMGKMEKKFGKYAIRNLSLYIVMGYVTGYLLLMFAPKVLSFIVLNPALVMKGEVWRLVTWIITPPTSPSFFTFVMLLFYFSMGNMLERTIGTFLYNVYMFGGMLITAVGIMLVYIVCEYVLHVPAGIDILGFSYYVVSTYYICLSIYLALAICYPDMTILYAMILPVKMKYMLVFELLILGYYFYYTPTILGRANILLSVVSFGIFYLSTKNLRRFSPKQIKRRKSYKEQIRVNKVENVIHRCVICGMTDKDAPDMQFRYCSKCTGNKEYCQNHLFTHTHK